MKSASLILISSLLFQILAPGFCYSSGQLQVLRTERVSGPVASPPSTGGRSNKEESKDQSIGERWLHEERARVRVEAPMISKRPIIGRFIRVNQHVLVIQSERGREKRIRNVIWCCSSGRLFLSRGFAGRSAYTGSQVCISRDFSVFHCHWYRNQVRRMDGSVPISAQTERRNHPKKGPRSCFVVRVLGVCQGTRMSRLL